MSDILLIVESPKMAPKAARVASAAFGRPVKVEATVGHLYDLPAQGKGVTWGAIHQNVVNRISHSAIGKKHIIIATDPDDEGERIAWQTSSLLKRGAQRIRVSSWDSAGFKRGLRSAGFDRGQAERAEARRICDRVIGWKYGAPGRVKAHMLAGALKNGLPSKCSWGKASPPPNLARFVVAAAVQGVSVKAASDFLAQSWQNGQLSYPRTDGEEYGPESLQLARSIAMEQGFSPFPEPLSGFHGSHEALLPLEPKSRDNFLMRVVRDMVAHSIAQRPYRPLPNEEVTGLPTDARWLLAAWRDGVGRPGTWADHIERLRELGVFDVVQDFYERRARDLLACMPDAFSDPNAHLAFYQAIDMPGSIEHRVEAGLLAFGLDETTEYGPSWGEHDPEEGALPALVTGMPRQATIIRCRPTGRRDLADALFVTKIEKTNEDTSSRNTNDISYAVNIIDEADKIEGSPVVEKETAESVEVTPSGGKPRRKASFSME